MKLVVLKVPIPDTLSSPKQNLEAGEHIVRRVVELAKLKDELDGTFLASQAWSDFVSGFEVPRVRDSSPCPPFPIAMFANTD